MYINVHFLKNVVAQMKNSGTFAPPKRKAGVA